MTTWLLSPGGKRRAEREERDRRKEARAAKKIKDKRKAKEEKGKRDAERARKEKAKREQKRQEEQEKQKKEEEEKRKEREDREKSLRMTDGNGKAQHKAAMKQAKEDATKSEVARLRNLKTTNPCLFDKELKFVITKLLHMNLYERNNLYCNLFKSENIKSWVEFLDMYQANPLSVYTDEFPYTDKDGKMITGPDGFHTPPR